MNIAKLTPKSLEQLLKFIGLREGEISLKEMDAILNAQRIENAGQQPKGTLKKIMLPQLQMNTIQEVGDDMQNTISHEKQPIEDEPFYSK